MVSGKERKQQFIKEFKDLLDRHGASFDYEDYAYQIWMDTKFNKDKEVSHDYCRITSEELCWGTC